MKKPVYLVATDLSKRSEPAVELAAELARHTEATIELCCVTPEDAGDQIVAFEERIQRELQRLARSHLPANAEYGMTVVVGESVSDGLTQAAERLDADAVFIAPNTDDRFRASLLGSSTERLLRRARTNVLVVRPECHPVQRVLVPLDGSNSCLRAFRRGLELARALGASVKALHVVPPPGLLTRLDHDLSQTNTYKQEKARVLKATQSLREWVSESPIEGVDVEIEAVAGEPAEQILHAIERYEPQLVVMGSHARSATEEFFVGSVSRSVATAALCSVLLVRARKDED